MFDPRQSPLIPTIYLVRILQITIVCTENLVYGVVCRSINSKLNCYCFVVTNCFFKFSFPEKKLRLNFQHKKLYGRLLFRKELSLCPKIKLLNPYIFAAWWCKPLIFQTLIIWSNRIHILKYLRFTTFGCSDLGIWKSEFVAKTQFLELRKLLF